VIVAVLVPAACAGKDQGSSPRTTGSVTTGGQRASKQEPTPDPKNLVLQLADLPTRFSLVPGERISVPVEKVLADPWSAGSTAVIRRERVAGYQISFWSPERQRIECAAAVYRSSSGAEEVFRLRTRRFRAFLGASKSGRPAQVKSIGDETSAYRFEVRRLKGVTVAWRYRNVLASCTTMGVRTADLRQMVEVAQAQQSRISTALT
jgi:hypothetical protein